MLKVDELPDFRYGCFRYNCPVPWCSPLQYTVDKIKQLGFMSPRIRVWLSESIHSSRHRQADELVYVTNLIQETGESMMRTASLSDLAMLDERTRRQKSDLKTLQQIKEDYEKLSKVME